MILRPILRHQVERPTRISVHPRMKETHTLLERHRMVNSEEIDFFWHLRPIRKINECLTDLSAPLTHKSSATLLVNRLEAFTDISYQKDPICRARIVNLRKLIC